MPLDYDLPRFRINGQLMEQYVNRQVLLLGHAISVDAKGKLLIIRSTDERDIFVHLANRLTAPVPSGCVVEVEGLVENTSTISGLSVFKFPLQMSDDFDRDMYNQYVTSLAEKEADIDRLGQTDQAVTDRESPAFSEDQDNELSRDNSPVPEM